MIPLCGGVASVGVRFFFPVVPTGFWAGYR